jgi:hypothetical protein
MDSHRCETQRREKTWKDYEGMLQRYIGPHLGERKMADRP